MTEGRVDIHRILEAGSFPTARPRSQSEQPAEPLERAPRFYSGTDGKVETILPANDDRFQPPCRYGPPPPPPTVEDDDDDDGEYAAEQPKVRGDPDQYPLIIDNDDYHTNPEQRFVLVSDPRESTGKTDGSKESTHRGNPAETASSVKPSSSHPRTEARAAIDSEAVAVGVDAAAALSAATTVERRRRPSARRAKSPADLPRIDTDMYGPRGESSATSRSRSSAPSYNTDYRYSYASRSPERLPRRSRDEFLSPEVIKSGPRNREQSYYHGDNRGQRTSRQRDRPSSMSNRRQGEFSGAVYSSSPGAGGRSRFEPEQYVARGASRGSRRGEGSVVSDSYADEPTASYPESPRQASSPSRRQETRSRRYTDQYSDGESEARRIRSSAGRKPIVIQNDGRSANSALDSGDARPDSRSQARSVAASSTTANGYRDNAPRCPRSPTSSAQPYDSNPVIPPYPMDDVMPSHDRPGYLEPEYWGPALASTSRGPQGTTPVPIRIPAPSGPRDSAGSDRAKGISHSWQPSPPKHRELWQDNPSVTSTSYTAPEPQYPSHISVRRYFEDPRRLGLPSVPRCPRKDPVAGMTDWLTIPECDNFTICPTCYSEIFADSPFRAIFKPLHRSRPELKAFCDFGVSTWYVIAWLLTLKNGLRNLSLFTEVSKITWDYGSIDEQCPGNRTSLRIWHTIEDPVTGRPVPDFSVCGECTRTIEALLPGVEGTIVKVPGPAPYSVCSMHPGPDKSKFLTYVDALERASDKALAEGGATTAGVARLAEDVARVSLDATCPRDRPVSNETWYMISWLPELTVCAACFEGVVYPVLSDAPRAVAKGFAMHPPKRLTVGTCQLYSDRMREVFKEACRRDDTRMLEDAVMERRDREDEVRAGMARLKGSGDAWAEGEMVRLEELWKGWE